MNDFGSPYYRKRRRISKWWIIGGGFIALIVATVASVAIWYFHALSPVNSSTDTSVAFEITTGMTVDDIGQQLQDKSLIRNADAFKLYTRLHSGSLVIQAGTYQLSPAYDVKTIIEHLRKGSVETVDITFYPGATLRDPSSIDASKRTDVVTMLQRAGYDDSVIEAALAQTYQSPLFQDKPADTSLEGYVYGDTYRFSPGTSAQAVLQLTFDTFWQDITEHKIVEQAAAYDMTLYEAITLASMIQREVSSPDDMRQVSQVFHSRLAIGMELGSDVTFIYAANQQNLIATPDLKSPYNTRIHPGLPPGPIATPSIEALEAAVNPSEGDYLFFVAGDDGLTYFSHTLAEHEANVAAHCLTLCG